MEGFQCYIYEFLVFFKWISLANTTTLNSFTRTSTIHYRHVLHREKSGFLILWSGQQTSRQVYSERSGFSDNSMRVISHPGMSEFRQEFTGLARHHVDEAKPNIKWKTPLRWYSVGPGPLQPAHMCNWHYLVTKQQPNSTAHTVQRKCLSQVEGRMTGPDYPKSNQRNTLWVFPEPRNARGILIMELRRYFEHKSLLWPICLNIFPFMLGKKKPWFKDPQSERKWNKILHKAQMHPTTFCHLPSTFLFLNCKVSS